MIDKDKLLETIIELREQEDRIWNEIAEIVNQRFNLSKDESSYRRLYKKNRSRNRSPVKVDSEDEEFGTLTRKSNGEVVATTMINENPANLSLEEIIKLFDLDPDKWQCSSFTTKVWNNLLKKEGEHKVLKNYSVKASFKPVKENKLTEEDLSWVFDFTKSIANNTDPLLVEFNRDKDNTLVLPILDTHIGKLAWVHETGENYDIKIASKRFRKAITGVVSRAKEVGFSKIIFPLGNDFFQYDNPANETTKGTRVDSDLRWKKLFKVGMELLIEALNFCKTYAPVDVILVQGNHDNSMSFYAFEALRGWYNNDDRVTIDEDIKTRTYRRVGVNLLGFTHGDKEKDNLYKIMQQEARELWGKTEYSEWIVGHFHRNSVDERQGVTRRVIGSFSGTDAWHYEHGYIGSLRVAQGIIYNKKQKGPYIIIHESVE